MEERKKYVIYVDGYNVEEERVVSMTKEQANAIRWLMNNFDINGCVELVENYEGETI